MVAIRDPASDQGEVSTPNSNPLQVFDSAIDQVAPWSLDLSETVSPTTIFVS